MNSETTALAERIVVARKQSGRSQAAAAREVGVSRQLWHQWERGRSRPPAMSLSGIALALDVSLEYLVGS